MWWEGDITRPQHTHRSQESIPVGCIPPTSVAYPLPGIYPTVLYLSSWVYLPPPRSDPEAGLGGDKKHEIYVATFWVAIFFMTYFYRAVGACPPPRSATAPPEYTYFPLGRDLDQRYLHVHPPLPMWPP